MIEIDKGKIGIIIEVKYAKKGNLEACCKEALFQINQKRYTQQLYEDGMKTIHKYGIACYKKQCRILLESE